MAQTISALASILGVLAALVIFYWGKRIERKGVNKALLAEIKRLLWVVCERHIEWRPKNTNAPLIPFTTPVYSKHAQNIGMLDRDVVANVASFYGYLHFLNALQRSRVEYDKLNLRADFDKTYQESLDKFCELFGCAFEKAFQRYNV